jgi:hypothetical protein
MFFLYLFLLPAADKPTAGLAKRILPLYVREVETYFLAGE